MSALARLLGALRPYRARAFWACAAMFLVALFNGTMILLLKPVVDEVLIARDERMLWLLVAAVPLAMALKAVASYSQNYLTAWLGQRAAQDIRADLFRRLQALPLSFHARFDAGDLLARATGDLLVVQSALNTLPLYLIRDSLTVLFLLISLFWLDWRFALLSLVGVPLAMIVLWVLSGKMRASSLQSQEVLGRLHRRFLESLQGLAVIRAFNYEEGVLAKFEAENDRFFAPAMRYLRAQSLTAPLLELSVGLVASLILYFGGSEVVLGRMTPGGFFAFLGAYLAAYAPLKNLARSNSELQRALACAERIFQLLDEHPASPLVPGAAPVPFTGLKDGIRLENARLRYPGAARPALDGLDLLLRRGETTVLAGPSGSGKSSVARLLLRLYDPDSGRVLFDGQDARALDPRSIRARAGLLAQETFVFEGTVFENVVLGLPVATLTEVERACELSGAAEFVRALPGGYRARLGGDGGAALSPGQRQRLGLARLILKDPDLVILDEAVSGLDAAAAARTQEVLAGLFAGKTVLAVSHRLDAFPRADRIVLLSRGRAVWEGGPAELRSQDGLARRLRELHQAEAPA